MTGLVKGQKIQLYLAMEIGYQLGGTNNRYT